MPTYANVGFLASEVELGVKVMGTKTRKLYSRKLGGTRW